MVKHVSSIDAKIYKSKKFPLVDVVCAWCQKSFKVSIHRMKRAKNLFCSEDHRRIGKNLDGGTDEHRRARHRFYQFNRYS